MSPVDRQGGEARNHDTRPGEKTEAPPCMWCSGQGVVTGQGHVAECSYCEGTGKTPLQQDEDHEACGKIADDLYDRGYAQCRRDVAAALGFSYAGGIEDQQTERRCDACNEVAAVLLCRACASLPGTVIIGQPPEAPR